MARTTMAKAMMGVGLAFGLLILTPKTAAAGGGMKNTELVETIERQVKAGLPADLLLDGVALPKKFAVPRGSIVDVTWRKAPAEGNAWVMVTASKDGKVSRRAFVRAALVAVREVLVVQRPLTKGQVVRAGDLLIEPRVGVLGVQLMPEALLGAPVLQDIAAGEAISSASVGLPAPVARGTSINVVSQVGHVRITVQARLETTARPGERAQARITRSRQIVRGRLIDDHTLVVGESGGAR